MLIAGFQKMTLLDYPDKIAALIFTQGCNFACGYCHNPEMIPKIRILPDRQELDPNWILRFLKNRKGLLDGVVISGGEPTLQPDLEDFLKKIKAMGFLVKLDTNGSHPEILKDLLKKRLVDFIAMDIKHSKKEYQNLAKKKCISDIIKSIRLIKRSGIPYEFRSTILPFYHTKADIKAMGQMIRGAKEWYLQNFRPLKTLDKKLTKERPFRQDELEELLSIAKPFADHVEIRNM